ncbi:hypothetical protein CVIRNUC_007744 [Coccomyxa viridis]|uniref:Cytochrome P450 n=1 Tax=Coccomyxa viridis TaxID=1274662 RepID=A0AAV1IDK1_9CHLO|nr:hypothetical protein CVIRNUC_007744 [Coccomyxa viridis]
MFSGTASPPCPSVLSTSTKDPFWRRVRKGVAPAFSQSNIQAASESSIAMAYRLADTLAAHGPAAPNAAFDVIGVFGFGKDFKATMDLHGEGAQACKCLARGMEIAVKSKLRPDTNIPFTPAWYEYRDTQTRLLSIFRNLMKEVLARGQPEAGDQTIAAFLRRIRAEDGAPLPELRFWSELSIFFFAGASARYYISQHPQVEAQLLEELRDLELMCGGAGKPRKLTPTDVQRLAYLHCVIKKKLCGSS